jgi:1,4-alpha-glucan branching enzyme
MPKEKKRKKDPLESKKEQARKVDSLSELDAESVEVPGDEAVEAVVHPEARAPELKATVEILDPEATRALLELEKTLPSGPPKKVRRKDRGKKKPVAEAPPAEEKVAKPRRKAAPSAAKAPAAKRAPARKVAVERSPLGEQDIYLFREGTHRRLFEKMGSHIGRRDGVDGTFFAVWAPSASRVSVVGDFNGWDPAANPMEPRDSSGIWETFVPGVGKGAVYKYNITSQHGDYNVDKADPFGFRHETPPDTASIVWDLDYTWGDGKWMKERAEAASLDSPMSVYEVHCGSWRRVPEEEGRSLTYLEMAEELPRYVMEMGFTHVELMPVTEYPFYGSWGYQTTGYFAATSRYGAPQDLMFLIDKLHQAGIGVILDWVPSHFPMDGHGLSYFDGTHLYEPADPRRGYHPDWKSMIFDYGRPEVRSFLISSAIFWMERFHIDALRVDAVASMLYLDYSREPGEWIPNQYGGRENLDAIVFLRKLNEAIYAEAPGAQSIAEESTAWPLVSRPTYVGGLGFGYKWDMGWMHDTLKYFQNDPINRKYHHNTLTFRQLYANSENFVLPLSHDEVVHMKGSLVGKMPGDGWQKFANVRLLYAYMYAQSGKKHLFMGSEIAQGREWSHEESLDWHLLEHGSHAGVQRFVKDLNALYRSEKALFELDSSHMGFEWIDCNDWQHSIIVILRRSRTPGEEIVAALNFTPVVRSEYRIGLPRAGVWTEILNSDSEHYGGSGVGNMGKVTAVESSHHGRPASMEITLPPLGAVFFRNLDPWPDAIAES